MRPPFGWHMTTYHTNASSAHLPQMGASVEATWMPYALQVDALTNDIPRTNAHPIHMQGREIQN